MNTTDSPPADIRQWSGLLRTGAWAAIASVILIFLQIALYFVWPPPDTAHELFILLHENPLRGLTALDVLYPLSNLLTLLLYLALGVVLWPDSRSAVTIALSVGGLGMAAYMASLRPVEMLQLSNLYSQAEPAHQVALLATGEGMLATWTGTAFDIYYLFNFAALLIFSVLVYQSGAFSRATALWGGAAAVLMAIPSNFGTVGLIFALLSLLPWSVFAVLVGGRLWRLSSEPRGSALQKRAT